MGPERKHELQQVIRHECFTCAHGRNILGPEGSLHCARRAMEEERKRLDAPVTAARAALSNLAPLDKKAPDADREAYEAQKALLTERITLEERELRNRIASYHLEGADGTPERFPEDGCPTILLWNDLGRMAEAGDDAGAERAVATLRTDVDKYLDARKAVRMLPPASRVPIQ